MRFPLSDWIDDHAGCRHDLGRSGMIGTVRHPLPSTAQVRSASETELRRRLAELVGVSPSRIFLLPGATEANAWATVYLARRRSGRSRRCRVEFPEYPPLFDVARWAGFRLSTRDDPAELAIVSQPRNPSGDLWSRERLSAFARGARGTLVDETFRDFSGARSVQRWGIPGVWTTGSFTKVYAADDLRVGYVVAPEEEAAAFARFHGLVADELASYSVAGALATLDARDALLRGVHAIVHRNQALWRRATPGSPTLAGSTAFDTSIGPDGDAFARRCLRASVLVCPGSFFGDRAGVRVGLTRRTFPRDLVAYLAVRAAAARTRTRRSAAHGEVRRIDGSAAGEPDAEARGGRRRGRLGPVGFVLG